MALSWWQHHKHCRNYYYFFVIIIIIIKGNITATSLHRWLTPRRWRWLSTRGQTQLQNHGSDDRWNRVQGTRNLLKIFALLRSDTGWAWESKTRQGKCKFHWSPTSIARSRCLWPTYIITRHFLRRIVVTDRFNSLSLSLSLSAVTRCDLLFFAVLMSSVAEQNRTQHFPITATAALDDNFENALQHVERFTGVAAATFKLGLFTNSSNHSRESARMASAWWSIGRTPSIKSWIRWTMTNCCDSCSSLQFVTAVASSRAIAVRKSKQRLMWVRLLFQRRSEYCTTIYWWHN